MSVRNLSVKDIFHDVSFTVNKGEIIGLAGMMGAGRSEIIRAIFGLDKYDHGEIIIDGNEISIKSPRDAIGSGIAMVSEDRAGYGFIGVRSIKDNILTPNTDLFASHGIVRRKKVNEAVNSIFHRLNIRAPSSSTLVSTLSGGNQQKVVLAKWLVRKIKVLIMDEPTRGIDVGAKQEIYKLITELAAKGMSVILISSEMPEVISMSHRVYVVAQGQIIGQLSKENATQDRIMKMIIGGANHEF